MPIQSYQEALDYWYRRVNYEQRGMPADLRELKLDRMRALLARLGQPERALRIIHIAGSKGKGSIAAMLATVLQRAGYRTGLFTSPHLARVEERIQIDGQMISAEELLVLMREIERAVLEVQDQHGPPTFFEIVTALGFLHFARRRVQLAVVEVGLGGRFDSTNVCDPVLAVISSISLDHTEQLGDTLAKIACEKAGIIKRRRPTISGAEAPEARAVIEEVARVRQAPLQEVGRDFTCAYQAGRITSRDWQFPSMQVTTLRRRWPRLQLALLGEHQAANAAVAIACVEQLRTLGLHVPDEAVAAGLREVRWPARLEVLCRRPFVILDCAHNVASIQALLSTLQSTFPTTRRILVFAGSRDKDLTGMLTLLVPHFGQAVFTRYTSSQRGAAAEELAGLWQRAGGLCGRAVQGPLEAWRQAHLAAGGEVSICVTGSVFLAGELREAIIQDLGQESAVS